MSGYAQRSSRGESPPVTSSRASTASTAAAEPWFDPGPWFEPPCEAPFVCEDSASKTPVLDALALQDGYLEPRDAQSTTERWLDGTHGNRWSGLPPAARFDAGRQDWQAQQDPWLADPKGSVSGGRGGGVAGTQVSRRDFIPAEAAPGQVQEVAPGWTAGASISADGRGWRGTGEIGRSRSNVAGDGGSTSGTFAYGTDGVAVGGKHLARHDGGDLTSSAGVGWGQQGLTVKGSSLAMGKKTATATLGDPSAGLHDHRQLGAGTRMQASAMVSSSATGDIATRPPIRMGDRWAVPYTVSASLGPTVAGSLGFEGLESGGAQTLGGMPGAQGSGVGAKVGASLGASLTGRLEGVKLFEDEAAARAFHLLPDPALLSTPALSADGAQEMAAGERTRVEVGARGSLGVSGEGTGGPSVSLGAQGGGAAGLEVERLDDRWFAVTRDLSADASAYGGLGAPGLDVSGVASVGGRSASTWRVDLSSKAGKAAYETLVSGGTPEPGPGVQPPLHATALTDGKHVGVGLPGLDFQVGGQSTDLEVDKPDGTRILREEGWETQSVQAWRWLQSWVTSVDSAVGLGAQTKFDVGGDERDSQVLLLGRTASNDARQNREALGRAAGVTDYTTGTPGRSTPGQWSVQTQFGPDSLDTVARAVQAERWDPDDNKQLTADQRRFIVALRGAGTDRAAQRQAVQDYGEAGPDTVSLMRSLLGKRGASFVALEGSETWTGVEGYEAAVAVLETEEEKVDTGGTADVENLHEQLRLQRVRLHDLTDYGSYGDVPQSLRLEEIDRTEGLIRRLESLLGRAGQDMGRTSPTTSSSTLAADIQDARNRMDSAYAEARESRDLHGVGWEGVGKPWHELAKVSVLGIVDLDGPSARQYEEAERYFSSAESARRRGVTLERTLNNLYKSREVERVALVQHTMLRAFDHGGDLFERAKMVYDSIEADHPELFP